MEAALRSDRWLAAEILVQSLNQAYAGVFDLPIFDFSDCAFGNARIPRDAKDLLDRHSGQSSDDIIMDGIFHASDSRPFLGSCQPGLGPAVGRTLTAVERRSKRDKPDPLVRGLLAGNVASLRDKRYEALGSVTARNRQLAEDANTTLSQIQRILSMELGTSIDLIARMARALKVRPHDLLTPYFSARPQYAGDEGSAPEAMQSKSARSAISRRYLSAVKTPPRPR